MIHVQQSSTKDEVSDCCLMPSEQFVNYFMAMR